MSLLASFLYQLVYEVDPDEASSINPPVWSKPRKACSGPHLNRGKAWGPHDNSPSSPTSDGVFHVGCKGSEAKIGPRQASPPRIPMASPGFDGSEPRYYHEAILAAREFLDASVPIMLFEWTYDTGAEWRVVLEGTLLWLQRESTGKHQLLNAPISEHNTHMCGFSLFVKRAPMKTNNAPFSWVSWFRGVRSGL